MTLPCKLLALKMGWLNFTSTMPRSGCDVWFSQVREARRPSIPSVPTFPSSPDPSFHETYHVERRKLGPVRHRTAGGLGGDEEEADVGQVESAFSLASGRSLRRTKAAEREGELHTVCGGYEAFARVPGRRGAGGTGVETHPFRGCLQRGTEGGREGRKGQ